jgi:hypothetical protein
MIFTLVGGGGGSSLNFEVVGNPKPENPKANTIWIDTDTEITGWAFSTTEPDLVDGFVWFPVGSASPVAFNALEENILMVYPLSAKQVIGGAWVDVSSESYQGGWVGWITYLFKEGEGEKVQLATTGSTINIRTDGIAFSGSSSKGLYADVAVTLEKTSTFCVEATITNVGTSDTYMGSVVAKTPSVYSSTRNDHPQTATARAKISADGVRTVYKLSLEPGTYHFGVSGNIIGTVHNMWYE